MGLTGLALNLPDLNQSSMEKKNKPNVIFILADDLGYNELGCYGQKKIKTPNIDLLAMEGMRFTQHYSGSPVCAPSRCTLLTGKHTGHAYIRDNDEMPEKGDVWKHPEIEGQRPLLPGTITIGTILKNAGYKTAAIGKWGLGGPDNEGDPDKQGFDHFYGYLCQRAAHNYYPTHLWRNGKKEMLEGNDFFSAHQKLPDTADPNDPNSYESYSGNKYSFDLMLDEAEYFIRNNKNDPFFLYFAPTLPHVALQVPEDSLKEYEGAFPETPYKGGNYLPNRTPKATYAAMISRLDRGVGKIMNLLKELNLDENTIIIFTSDNGPTFAGGVDYTFFESAGQFRGLKGSVYEGGIRTPMIARWPGIIPKSAISDHICAFWDFLPTLTDILKIKKPVDTDGISILPTLVNKSNQQKKHEYLYWEYLSKIQAVRLGNWKGIRLQPDSKIELYNLKNDIEEKNNIAKENPEIIAKISDIMMNGRIESKLYPIFKKKKSENN